MTQENMARLRAHRNNVHRYQKLLATRLSDLERGYIERRLSEEQASVEALLQETFPDRLSLRVADAMSHGRTTNLEMDALLHPADAFIHPMDVVEDCDLTTYEKRAVLSSWAADACGMQGVSKQNWSSHGSPVSFDDILDALRALDNESERRACTDTGIVNQRRSGPDKSKDGQGEANVV
jgi:hypothetical protein